MTNIRPNNVMVFGQVILLIIITIMVPSNQSVSAKTVTDLLDFNHVWKSINYATIIQNNSQIDITVNTNNTNKIYNRAYMDTIIKSKSVHNFLSMVYSTNTTRNTMFIVEILHNPMTANVTKAITIMQNNTDKSWTRNLGLTLGYMTTRTYEIPHELINKAIQIRLYLITDEPGESVFNITRAVILDS